MKYIHICLESLKNFFLKQNNLYSSTLQPTDEDDNKLESVITYVLKNIEDFTCLFSDMTSQQRYIKRKFGDMKKKKK